MEVEINCAPFIAGAAAIIIVVVIILICVIVVVVCVCKKIFANKAAAAMPQMA